MRWPMLVINGVFLGGITWMALFGGTEIQATKLLSERSLPGVASGTIEQLEAQAAVATSPHSVVALSSAYLDHDQPGLATAVIERAPREMRARPEVGHLYARSLFHRGRAREALAVARNANESCIDSKACAPWLVAKTIRQVAFLEQLVAAGIDDAQANPDGTRAAYERSTHEVRLVAMR